MASHDLRMFEVIIIVTRIYNERIGMIENERCVSRKIGWYADVREYYLDKANKNVLLYIPYISNLNIKMAYTLKIRILNA